MGIKQKRFLLCHLWCLRRPQFWSLYGDAVNTRRHVALPTLPGTWQTVLVGLLPYDMTGGFLRRAYGASAFSNKRFAKKNTRDHGFRRHKCASLRRHF